MKILRREQSSVDKALLDTIAKNEKATAVHLQSVQSALLDAKAEAKQLLASDSVAISQNCQRVLNALKYTKKKPAPPAFSKPKRSTQGKQSLAQGWL